MRSVVSPSKDEDILILDTGGGKNSTITTSAWHVFERTNHVQEVRGYGEKGEGRTCAIVNAATKAWIKDRDIPVILILNYATLNEDPEERESLVVPFEMMRHGIETDLTPVGLGGTGSMVLQDEEFPFEWDKEKLFIRISKPDEGDLEELEIIELNSPVPDMAMDMNSIRRGRKGRIHNGVTLEEWRKRLAMLPERVVKKTLANCTNLYFNVEVENRQDPCQHFKYRFPGIRYPRQTETFALDTFFPTVKTRRGNICSQFLWV